MITPGGFRADSERNRRASIAVPTRYVTQREPVVLHSAYLTDGPVDNSAARDRRTHLGAGCSGLTAGDRRGLR